MELAIHLHLGGLSLSNTVSRHDSFGVNRARSTVHNWLQKADLEPRGGRDPDQIALDETVIKVTGDRFWCVAAVEPYTTVVPHVWLYLASATALTKMVLRELQDKPAIDDAEFLFDGPPGCMPACSNSAYTSATKHTATATPSNVSFKI
jgi:transposase-like protein